MNRLKWVPVAGRGGRPSTQDRRARLPLVNTNGGPDQPRDPHGRWIASEASTQALRMSQRVTGQGSRGRAALRRAEQAAVDSDRAYNVDESDTVRASAMHHRAARSHSEAAQAYNRMEPSYGPHAGAYRAHSWAMQAHSNAARSLGGSLFDRSYEARVASRHAMGGSITHGTTLSRALEIIQISSQNTTGGLKLRSKQHLRAAAEHERMAEEHDRPHMMIHAPGSSKQAHLSAAKLHREAARYHDLLVNVEQPTGNAETQINRLLGNAKEFHRPENYDKVRDLLGGKELWAGGNDWETGTTWAGIHDKRDVSQKYNSDRGRNPNKWIEIDHSKCPGCKGTLDARGRDEKLCRDYGKKQVEKWVRDITHNFDPKQKRDEQGRWTASQASLRALAESQRVLKAEKEATPSVGASINTEQALKYAQDAAVAADHASDTKGDDITKAAAHEKVMRLHHEAAARHFAGGRRHDTAEELHRRAAEEHDYLARFHFGGSSLSRSTDATHLTGTLIQRGDPMYELNMEANSHAWYRRNHTAAALHDRLADMHTERAQDSSQPGTAQAGHQEAARLHREAARYHQLMVTNKDGGWHRLSHNANPDQPRDAHGRWAAAEASQAALKASQYAHAQNTHYDSGRAEALAQEAVIASDKTQDMSDLAVTNDPVKAAALHEKAFHLHVRAGNMHGNHAQDMVYSANEGEIPRSHIKPHGDATKAHMLAARRHLAVAQSLGGDSMERTQRAAHFAAALLQGSNPTTRELRNRTTGLDYYYSVSDHPAFAREHRALAAEHHKRAETAGDVDTIDNHRKAAKMHEDAARHHELMTTNVRYSWSPLTNAKKKSGDNCGTGAGGFKKGNKCAAGTPHTPGWAQERPKNRLLDYEEYQRLARETNPHDPFGERRRNSFMSGFPLEVLTPEGRRIFDEFKKLMGRNPSYRNANATGMRLKHETRNEEEHQKMEIFRDWLLDKGYDVQVEQQQGLRITSGMRRDLESDQPWRRREARRYIAEHAHRRFYTLIIQ